MSPDRFHLAALSLVVAAVLWVTVFQIRPLDFWIMLSLSTLTLLVLSVLINRDGQRPGANARIVLYGIVSAFLLYGLFYLGFQLTKSNPMFSEGVSSVYELRSSQPAALVGLMLAFPIGPGEEVYWRGLIQRRFAEKFGSRTAYLLATLAYALVHLPTLNIPLIMTAFIGGLVWGYLYKSTGSLMPAIVSHVLWDVLIFVIAPLS